MRKLFTTLLFLGLTALAYAGPEENFVQAKAAYDKGNYAEASLLYERLLSNGVSNVEVEYNLGNAYFKSGDLPLAVLHYRRAWYDAPRDPDIAANLHFALSAAGAAEPDLGVGGEVFFALSEKEWIEVGLIAYLIFMLLLALMLLRPAFRPLLLKIAVLPVALLLLAGGGWWSWQQMLRSPEWVVVRSGATTSFSPVEKSTAHYKLPLAAIVRQHARETDWVEVEYDGETGWVKKEYLKPIRP